MWDAHEGGLVECCRDDWREGKKKHYTWTTWNHCISSAPFSLTMPDLYWGGSPKEDADTFGSISKAHLVMLAFISSQRLLRNTPGSMPSFKIIQLANI
jgi:hypothetical protein